MIMDLINMVPVFVVVVMASPALTKPYSMHSTGDNSTDVWPEPTKSCSIKNCGPPVNLTFTPWPLVSHKKLYAVVDLVAAHDMFEGFATAFLDPLPFGIEYAVCEQTGMKCPWMKGEKFHYSWRREPVTSKPQRRTGRFTIVNTMNELMLCVTFDCYI